MSSQVNIRLDARLCDRLDAIAFVRRSSVGAVARIAIEEFVDAHVSDPGVREALEARAAHDRATAPKVAPIARKRRANNA